MEGLATSDKRASYWFDKRKRELLHGRNLTGDARPRFFESYVITLCSRSRCGAREAMTVGCKPTRAQHAPRAKRNGI